MNPLQLSVAGGCSSFANRVRRPRSGSFMSVPILVCECGLRVKAPGAVPGRVGRCPNCGGTLQMPDVPAPAKAKKPRDSGGTGYQLEPVVEATVMVPRRSHPDRDVSPRTAFAQRKRSAPHTDGLLPALERPETNWFASVSYPLRGADSLGVVATTSVVFWLFIVLVPEYCLSLVGDAESMGMPTIGHLIALISVLPFALLFPLVIFYWLQYLGRVLVSSAMGETRPPRSPDRNFDGFFSGMSPWLVWLVLGVSVGCVAACRLSVDEELLGRRRRGRRSRSLAAGLSVRVDGDDDVVPARPCPGRQSPGMSWARCFGWGYRMRSFAYLSLRHCAMAAGLYRGRVPVARETTSGFSFCCPLVSWVVRAMDLDRRDARAWGSAITTIATPCAGIMSVRGGASPGGSDRSAASCTHRNVPTTAHTASVSAFNSVATDHQRRHEIHDVLEWPHPDAVFHESGPQRIDVDRLVKLHHADRPFDSHVDHVRAASGMAPARCASPLRSLSPALLSARARTGRARRWRPHTPGGWP